MPCHSQLNVLAYLEAMMLADKASEQMAVGVQCKPRANVVYW